MATLRLTVSGAMGNIVCGSVDEKSEDGIIGHTPTLAAAKSGTLTTRTDDNTGVITLGSGHGLTDSDEVDVYWSGGVRYGMAITSYDATTITIDGGAGDVLPTQDTAVVAGPITVITDTFDGDDLEILMATAGSGRAHLNFLDSGDASLLAVELPDANRTWLYAGVGSNPLTGNAVATIEISSGYVSGTNKMTMLGLYDSTS